MSHKPSKREQEEVELNLNLNPMIDMFAVLIPALLMLSAVVEVAIIEVGAPSIGPSSPEEKPPDKPPLNLTVTVLERGYIVAADGADLSAIIPPSPSPTEPNIPLVEKTFRCNKYKGTTPPPRSANMDRPPCGEKEATAEKSFKVYDAKTLSDKVLEIHNQFPDERRIIVAAEQNIQYESITDVLDATRSTKSPQGETIMMFDQVVLRPAPN
jgi:biopolymer transport protein ExbD